ncbi:MAG: hypothetical protein IPH30_08250 [Betaproteobacteria bacterium]|nr:hypothetical protein [Betaproteobacteria bacterium]
MRLFRPSPLLLCAVASAAVLAAWPQSALAGSGTDNSAPYNLNRDLTVRVTYPRFLRFRVGAVGAGVVNQVLFTATTANIGNAVPIAGTGGETGGGGAANVEVVGNNGQVTITATNNSGGNGLGTGNAGDGFINYNQISTTTNNASLPAPTLSNAGGTNSLPVLNSALVTQRTAVWTYSYLNATIPSAGAYGAGGGTGGRVTYTATMP